MQHPPLYGLSNRVEKSIPTGAGENLRQLSDLACTQELRRMHLSPIAHKYALIDEDHVRKITQDLCHLLHMPLHLAKEKGFPLRGFSLMVVDHPKNDLQSHAAIPGKDLPDVITAFLCQIPVPKCTDIDHCQLQRISHHLTKLVKLIDWAVAGIKIDDALFIALAENHTLSFLKVNIGTV